MSVAGSIMCVVVMFVSQWQFALFAIFVGVVVYKYIEYRGY